MNRRQFTKLATLGTAFAPLLSGCETAAKPVGFSAASANVKATPPLSKAEAEAKSLKAHHDFMAAKDVKMQGNEQIAMLLYPGFTTLDLFGPHYLFASMMGAKVHLVSPTDDLTPVLSDVKVGIVPTLKMSECPDNLDILFVPGGANGTLKAMKNEAFIAFIKQKAATAKYMTSVCTGSLLLGQAGLLNGKRATTHWVSLDLLTRFGATPVKDRVVWDGNLITGAGITAGLDFGLAIVAALRGATYAKGLQLQLEYDPQPPYAGGGSPDKAEAFTKDFIEGMFAPLVSDFALAIK